MTLDEIATERRRQEIAQLRIITPNCTGSTPSLTHPRRQSRLLQEMAHPASRAVRATPESLPYKYRKFPPKLWATLGQADGDLTGR